MKRSDFVCLSTACAAAAAAPALASTASDSAVPANVAGVAIPDSYIARQATAQAREVEHPHVFRHSMRSFLFAELIAKARGVKHDVETVYVAAVLHDLGLAPQFATPHARFEIDGANFAKQLLVANPERARIAWDAVVLHSTYGIARYKEPEVDLVSAGVITDVGAAFAQTLEKSAVQAVLAAYPRSGFNDAFLTVLADYARRKPDTVGHTFVEDVAIRTVPGYQTGNFFDSLKSGDAFAQLGFTLL